MKKNILIADDDDAISELIAGHLEEKGYAAHAVFDGKSAINWVRSHVPALVMLDVRLPDIDGMEVLREIFKIKPDTYVLMISGQADVPMAVECLKVGARDFIEKSREFSVFTEKIDGILKQIASEDDTAKKELGAAYKHKSFIGSSEAMKKVFQEIDLAAKSDVNVLIQGESGTGKELVARAIHSQSTAKQGAFIAVNCAAIPENLLESELFGHEKGAFTGAVAQKIGKFEQAHGGTIFLDEIGDLTVNLQVKLLRVLQEREIERVGGTQQIPVQVRLLTATHRDLRRMVEEKQFREDLYYRINVFPIKVPPLRNHKEDIPELFAYFVKAKSRRKGNAVIKMDEAALRKIMDYDWPGNIREFENFIERALLFLGDRKLMTAKDVSGLDGQMQKESAPPAAAPEPDANARVTALNQTEKAILEKALEDAGGNVSKAAELVQMSRDSFYRKMKKYAINH